VNWKFGGVSSGTLIKGGWDEGGGTEYICRNQNVFGLAFARPREYGRHIGRWTTDQQCEISYNGGVQIVKGKSDVLILKSKDAGQYFKNFRG
jgi:hypothetical protein